MWTQLSTLSPFVWLVISQVQWNMCHEMMIQSLNNNTIVPVAYDWLKLTHNPDICGWKKTHSNGKMTTHLFLNWFFSCSFYEQFRVLYVVSCIPLSLFVRLIIAWHLLAWCSFSIGLLVPLASEVPLLYVWECLSSCADWGRQGLAGRKVWLNTVCQKWSLTDHQWQVVQSVMSK